MSLVYRSELYRHVQSLDFSFFDKRETGEILSKFEDMRSAIEGTIEMPVLQNAKGEIGFHDVSFSYDGNIPVLQKIDLVIPTHTTVALVGRSGSGKSTLAKLIPRFYDPDKGYVSIDGKDIRKYRLKSLRHQIGFAMQGSHMFQGTILENLTFGRAIPLSDVEDAARVAYIHDFVASLPEGYQTEIGEQGTDNIHPDHPPHRSIGPCQRSRSRKLGSAQTPICRVAM